MDVVTATATGAAVIAGVIEVLKRTGLFDAGRFGGLVAIVLGVSYFTAGVASSGITGTAGDALTSFEAAVLGITTGLTAAGVYSTIRASTSSA